MIRSVLIIPMILLSTFLSGQVITGAVLNQETREPIDYASVFFNGTFVGTTTDEEGRFELDISNYRSRPLSIRAVGYFTETIPRLFPGKTFQILLKPRFYNIEEVSVTTRSLVRKRRACMRIFKKEFIGLTSNAHKCYILNEEDITFNYHTDDDTLRAFASKPILLQNLSLGYDITYYLDRFEYIRSGNIVFFYREHYI
jgi:hypothetical protein